MKNLINLTFLFFVLFAGYNVSAQDVIFESNLRKLSIALRGKVPTLVEINKYREIKATSTANQALQLASTDFVNSKDFVGKFSNNVSNLFRVFQSPLNNHKYLDYENPPELNTGNPPSVFNFLVQEIFLKDLPWTELLVKSEYYSTDIESNIDFNVSNRRFFATAGRQSIC